MKFVLIVETLLQYLKKKLLPNNWFNIFFAVSHPQFVPTCLITIILTLLFRFLKKDFTKSFSAWCFHKNVPHLRLSMNKVSMSYLFSLSRYQAKCVIKFLFRQLMTSKTLRFIIDQINGWQVEKKVKKEIQKSEYLVNKRSFLDEIKNIFHSFCRVGNKKLIKNSGQKLWCSRII